MGCSCGHRVVTQAGAEQTLRADQQHEEHDRVGDGGRPRRRDVDRGHGLGDTEDQRRDHGALEAAEAAEHHDRQEPRDPEVVGAGHERVEHAGDRATGSGRGQPEPEDQRRDRGHLDPDQLGRGGVGGRRPDGPAEPGLGEDQPQGRPGRRPPALRRTPGPWEGTRCRHGTTRSTYDGRIDVESLPQISPMAPSTTNANPKVSSTVDDIGACRIGRTSSR